MSEEAGRRIYTRFRGDFVTHLKERSSAVTEVDHEAEAFLRDAIHARYPQDSILGEEAGLDRRDDAWVWTLDPIDGTHNFAGGMPIFSVAVGVLHEGDPVVGVIHDPCRKETFAGARGRGARLNGAALRVDDRPLDAMSMIAVRHRFFRGPRARLLEGLPTRKHRCLGSVCLEMAYVAAGNMAAAVAGSVRLWEAAPAGVLVEEAGGVVTGLDDARLFPIDDDIAAFVERRMHLIAGGRRATETIAAELAKLPV